MLGTLEICGAAVGSTANPSIRVPAGAKSRNDLQLLVATTYPIARYHTYVALKRSVPNLFEKNELERDLEPKTRRKIQNSGKMHRC